MCMCVRRSMFFGVSYLVLWDNVQNKPDQSTLGRDERKREKMGFITHSGDRSISLQGEKKKTPHSVQFHTEIPTITKKTKSSGHMHNTMQLHKMGKLSSSSQRSRLRELGQE